MNKTLQLAENISKFYKWKAKTTFKLQVDVYLNSRTKFLLNNRTSKALKLIC